PPHVLERTVARLGDLLVELRPAEASHRGQAGLECNRETPDDGHRDVDGGLRRAAALVEPLDQIEATRRGVIPLEVGDGLRTAGGNERGQLLSDDSLAEWRVVPGERLLEAAGLDVSQELEPDLRVEGLGREALGDDPIDRDPVLAALSAMGS